MFTLMQSRFWHVKIKQFAFTVFYISFWMTFEY
ncbi:hypothetical protein MED297_18763 [Reinekea sp. MED297]|uniref:Uncharacterized protein n=1 Tax=Reinekea blandensis MED297 TaxID=314283 RepID=A4BF24_9GAMM|nr:hypothetical protein MED297_18763 [Reinekea sp. MED297] [Reinekea blandensis MED297]